MTEVDLKNTPLPKMFPGLDLNLATARYKELGKNLQLLIKEYLSKGYPKGTAAPPASNATLSDSTPLVSADFSNIEEEVPPAYKSYALKFLANEFPNLKEDFLLSKLNENNSHIFPTFKYIFKRYYLVDCVLTPDDQEGRDIYDLDNDVKTNYSNVSVPKKNIRNEESEAVKAYPKLTHELIHISQKRQSYQTKVTAIKTLIDKRRAILSGPDSHSLIECSLCNSHYMAEEICYCKGGHAVCRCDLRDNLVATCLSMGKSKTKCVVEECTAQYQNNMIKLALGKKKYQKFEISRIQNELNFLKSDPNTYKCPFCPYRVTSTEKPKFIYCQFPKCGKVTCTLCGNEEITHKGGICPVTAEKQKKQQEQEEKNRLEKERAAKERRERLKQQQGVDLAVARRLDAEQRANAAEAERLRLDAEKKKKEKEEADRKRAEEAKARKEEEDRIKMVELEADLRTYVRKKMDESVISICPGCLTKIAKNQGCNHIHCPKCDTDFCYNCRKIIRPIPGQHINNACKIHFDKETGPCPGKWFTKQEVMDANFRAEAKILGEKEWRELHKGDPLAINIPLKGV